MSYFKYQPKNTYYTVTDEGKPLALLHGDSTSSATFELLKPLYESRLQLILIDSLGNGKLDRVETFPVDLWLEEARQVITLLEHLHYGKVNLAGISGGAWAAVNAAMLRPNLVERVVAGSFDGWSLAEDFADPLLEEKALSKQEEHAIEFHQWCQGNDWGSVVDENTGALVRCAREKRPLFTRPLRELQVPLLLTGSREDEMVRKDFLSEYEVIAGGTGAQVYVFPIGSRPVMASNAEQAVDVIYEFIYQEKIGRRHTVVIIRLVR